MCISALFVSRLGRLARTMAWSAAVAIQAAGSDVQAGTTGQATVAIPGLPVHAESGGVPHSPNFRIVPASSSAIDGEWSDLAPPQRTAHAAAYDNLHDRMLVFGGSVDFSDYPYATNDTWSLGLAGPPTWTRLETSGDLPVPASNHVTIYDSARDRLLVAVAGGNAGVWVLSLNDLTWTHVAASGTPPSVYAGTSTIFDSLRNRLLVFGGYALAPHGIDLHNDVWSLDLSGTPAWSRLLTQGNPPSPRYDHAAVYDLAHDQMVIFGGAAQFGALNNEAWALDLSGTPSWVQFVPSGAPPSPRAGSLGVYDSTGNVMLVYGGSTDPGNDVWALSLGEPLTWTQLAPDGPPSPRPQPSLILDTSRRQLLLYGGSYDGRGWETWSLPLSDPSHWTRTGEAPPGRDNFSAIHDLATNRMIIFGGFDYRPTYTNLNDLWAKDLGGSEAWTHLLPTGAPPSPRSAHSAIMDLLGHRMIVFGGFANNDLDDTWALSLEGSATWSQIIPAGSPPPAREAASAIYDPARGRMVLFGGDTGGTQINYWNDVWALSLDGPPAWTRLDPAGTPPSPRAHASAVYDPPRDRMLVFGGISPAGFADTVWALSLDANPAWSVIHATGSPGGRVYHSAIYDPMVDRMVVFGGGVDRWVSDVWALSLSGVAEWSELHPSGTPPYNRVLESAIYDPGHGRMVLFGGFTPGQGIDTFDYNDTWALTWESNSTAVQVSLESALAEPGVVHLSWFAPVSTGFAVNIYRSREGGAWDFLTRVSPAGGGRIVYDDRAVSPGVRYGYRLGFLDGAGEHFAGEAWVLVPAASRLALHGIRPNPTRREIAISFSLPSAAHAMIELYDIAGRRVFARDVSAMGSGDHVVDVGREARLSAGVYVVRLSQGSRTVTAQACVLR